MFAVQLTSWSTEANNCATPVRTSSSSGTLARGPSPSYGFGLSVPETDERAKIIEAEFWFLPDSEPVHLEWRRLVVRHEVARARVGGLPTSGVWHQSRFRADLLRNPQP